MKKLLLIIPFLLASVVADAQKDEFCWITFDNPSYQYCSEDTLIIDTFSNPSNIWQIGQPDKPVFYAAHSQPNALVTLLDTCYPSNDTSSFTIFHVVDYSLTVYGIIFFSAYYCLDSDTLSDFGTIEYSPDNGLTWINLISDTFYYQQNFYTWSLSKPVLTGSSGGWQLLNLMIHDPGFFIYDVGDTLLWRFSFFSDNIQTCKAGWMIDDISIMEHNEGINDIDADNAVILSPNPATTHITLQLPPQFEQATTIEVHDRLGLLVLKMHYSAEVDVSKLSAGLYFVVVSNEDGERVTGRFVKE